MLALPGILLLTFIEYLRPQVHFPALQSLSILHVSAALATGGFVLDLRLALSRLRPAPHLLPTLLFFAWCLVTVAVRDSAALLPRLTVLLIPCAFYLLAAHALQSFRALEVLAALLLAISVLLAGFGIHQGMAPRACHRVVPVQGEPTWVYDGRPCESRLECEADGEPGSDYACERAGLLGTSTIGGRVRWMGTMEDPNELSLALGITIPFAFAFLERRRSLPRLAILAAAAVTAGICAVLTRSRSGQLVFLTVLGSYFVRRVGLARGGVAGAILALPLLLWGGRDTGEAQASTQERTFLWWYGLHLFTDSPLVGIGAGRFLEYHHQTAHSSFVLALAELGLPGLLLLSAVLWTTFKIPLAVLRRPGAAPVALAWARALLAALAGLLVGITFLSFSYKNLLWLFVGLTGALYQAMRRHDPAFEVRFGIRDLALVTLGDLVLVAAHIGFTGWKLGW